jgi:hypothetical protein
MLTPPVYFPLWCQRCKEPVLGQQWLKKAFLGFFSAISGFFPLLMKENDWIMMNGSFLSLFCNHDLIKRPVATPLTP